MPYRRILLPAVFFLLSQTIHAQAPQKLALIVAIDKYADPRWNNPRLHSLNDVPLVKGALMRQGFAEADINVLTNEQATKQNILSALDKLATAKPGAVIVFHFSGHGQQIYDADDVKNPLIRADEEDGYDEALVTYQASLSYSPADTGQHHLRDDELAPKYAAITKRVGPTGSFLVLLDACHSGNSTKGLKLSSRGTGDIFKRPGYKPVQSSNEKGYFSEAAGQPFFSNFMLISASGSEQRNDETVNKETGEVVGALAYAFSKSLTNLKGEVNYHVFFEWVKYIIQSGNSIQNPQAEGNRNLLVLGGGKNILPLKDELVMAKLKDETTVSFPRGQLHDVYENTAFSVFPVEQNDAKATPLATGVVTSSGWVDGVGKVNVPLPKDKPLKIVFTRLAPPTITTRVRVEKNLPQRADILAMLATKKVSVVEDNPDLGLLLVKNRTVLINRTGDTLFSAAANKVDTAKLFQSIKNFSKAELIRSLGADAKKNYLDSVKVSIKPVRLTLNNDGEVTNKEYVAEENISDKNGNMLVKAAPKNAKGVVEGFEINVINPYNITIYFSLVEVLPDNRVNLPSQDDAISEQYRIAANGSREFLSYYTVDEQPFGRQVWKIFISSKQLDLSGAKTKSAGGGSVEQFFKDIESESFGNKKAPVSVIQPGQVSIRTFDFFLVRARK